MDELERAWVRNKAMEHYRRTRGEPKNRLMRVGTLLIAALVEVTGDRKSVV